MYENPYHYCIKVLFLNEDFRGMRLGSLNFTTAGEEALLKERAKYREFGDVFAMAEALKKHEIPGFAIDTTMLDYYLVDFEKQAPGICDFCPPFLQQFSSKETILFDPVSRR